MLDEIQNRVQQSVNSLDGGKAQRVLQVLGVLAFVAGVLAVYTYTQFRGLREAEAMDYAQIARNLAHGNGFTTHCVRPLEFHVVERSDPELIGPHPDVRRAPLYPAALAAGFVVLRPDERVLARSRIFAPEIKVVIPIGLAFVVASGILVWVLGRALFDARVALVAVVVFALSDAILAEAVSGLATSMAIFLVLATWASALATARAASRRRTLGLLLLTAACAVMGALTHYALIVIPIAVAVYLHGAIDRGRWLIATGFIALVTVGIGAWLARNSAVSGTVFGLLPYEALRGSALYQDDAIWRTLHPRLDDLMVFKTIEAKFWINIREAVNGELWQIGGTVITGLFALSFFYRFVRDDVHVLRWALLLGIMLLVAWLAVFGGGAGNLLLVFAPFAILYGVAFFYRMLDMFDFTTVPLRASLTALLIAISAVPLVLTLMVQRPGVPYPPYYAPLVRQVAQLLDQDEVLCTDIPEATAWYGGRTSLQLPGTLKEYYRIGDTIGTVSGLYLTTATGNRAYLSDLASGSERDWLPLLNRQIPVDFPLFHGISLPPGTSDQLFLTDRVRWRE